MLLQNFRPCGFAMTAKMSYFSHHFPTLFLSSSHQVYMAMLVKDKSEKHLIMMEQNGLSRWTYWAVTYIFNFMLYAVIAIIITIFSLAFQIRLFTQVRASFKLAFPGIYLYA